MKRLQRVPVGVSLVLAALLASAATQHSVHLSALTGNDPAALASPQAKVITIDGRTARDRAMGMSSDRSFSSGLYASEVGKGSIDAYPVDEFMYFVSGDMLLTSSDGTSIHLKQGDAVHVPRGWRGTWQTTGYTKFYVVYDVSKH